MSPDPENLSRTQRWMQAVITHPAGVVQGAEGDEARDCIPTTPESLEEVVTRSRSLTAVERLAIYSRSYFARLGECLRAEYPVLVELLGRELFDRFAFEFLQAHPPHSYTLARVGADFTNYLAKTRPGGDESSEERESWPDLIIDLARLERAFFEVYDGPGEEGHPLPDGAALQEVLADRGREFRLTPASCLRVLRFRHAVDEIFLKVRRGGKDFALGAPADRFLAITRRDYTVRLFPLTQAQHELLSALIAGDSLRDAAKALETTPPDVTVSKWLADWADRGFFREIRC